jgi:16S rRNA (cytosine1402-N4)-methyltransferase
MQNQHISVLLNESLALLNLRKEGVYLDCTFGAGGHTSKILEQGSATVFAIDRDPTTKKFADILKEKYPKNFFYFNSKFSEILNIPEIKPEMFDGILMDLGFSSMQIDNAERGFSFMQEGKLDMRMGNDGYSAEDFVNNEDEETIANVIYKYGDEKKSRRIAKFIVENRRQKRIVTTTELAEIIKRAAGRYNDKIHPATRSFQAIRIHINQEFEELEQALENNLTLLKSDGVLAVITFHSGEDTIVKGFFREKAGKNEKFNRYLPENSIKKPLKQNYSLLTNKPIIPSEAEILHNVRSRSAKLRGLKKF